MNGLSWILLLAELSGNARTAAVIVGFCAGFVLGVGAMLSPVLMDPDHSGFSREGVKRVFRNIAVGLGICIGIIVLVPSKQTVLLIGASQAGEQILQLQEVQEIGGEAGALATDTIKLLRQMVSDQLSEAEE